MQLFLKQHFKNQILLVEELNKGNKLAYEYLYSTYYNALCVYANSFVNDVVLAEEFVQNTMINVWNKKPNIIISSSLKSYLYKSVYNLFINYYRLKQKELTYANQLKHEALNYFIEADDDLISEKIKIVKAEIEKLPGKCKEVFIMNKVQGMKYKEVAEALNISIKTVEAQISKALKQLKRNLK